MKKKVLSLLFACIMIVSVFAFAGCETDELKAQIDENATKAETAVADTATKAAKDLADAKAALEALIAAGDQTDAKALADAVKDLNAAIEAAKTASTGADDALKADLTAAIAAAKTELSTGANTALEAAVKKLEDAVALKVDAAAYTKAVADLEAAVAAAKSAANTFATEADAALKTELTAAIAKAQADALADAKAYIDAKAAELSATQTADKAELAGLIAELKKATEAADEAAKKLVAEADAALKAELQAKLDALESSIKAADKTAADAWGEWNEATDVVIEKLYDLSMGYAELQAKAYYGVLPTEIQEKLLKIVIETEIKLIRSVDVAAANAAYNYAKVTFDTIDGIFEVCGSYNLDYYYADQVTELEDAVVAAMKALAEMNYETDVAAIGTKLAADLDAVLTKAEIIEKLLESKGTDVQMVVSANTEWSEHLAKVAAMLDAQKAEDIKVFEAILMDVEVKYGEYKTRYDLLVKLQGLAEGYNSDAKQLAAHLADENKDKGPFTMETVKKYFAQLKAVEEWYNILGETNEENKKMIDATIFDTLKANFAARKDAHTAYAAELLAKLNSFGAEYVYNYSEANQKAVYDLYEEYNTFAKYVEKQGFTMGDDLAGAYKVFAEGAYTRATKIAVAKVEAEAINARVEELAELLTYLSTFKSAYQVEMESINEAVKTWKNTYFADAFAAEMVDGNVNYALLDHAAYAALCDLYTAKLGPIEAAIKDVAAKFAEPGFVTINLLSSDEIAAAKASWEILLDLVADLGLDTMNMDIGKITGIDGDATTAKIANLLDSKTIEFKEDCAKAAAEYEALNILSANNVTIYDKADVDAMAKWYKEYLGMNVADAASELPADGKNLKLSDTVTITDELYAAAKATYTAWDVMVKAKVAEEKALEEDIAAFLAGTINTESRAAYDALVARYNAFMNGTAVPAPYAAGQYKVNTASDLYAIDTTELDKAGAKIADLEAKRDALIARLDALTTADAKNALLDATKATENDALIDALEADMIAFTAENEGFNCFVASEGTAYTNREVIIDQSRAIVDIAVIYAQAIANVELIVTEDVKADLKARATAARDAAVELILTLDVEAWADSNEFAIEIAKLSVVQQTIDLYLYYAPVKGEVAVAERYENSVKSLIVNRITVEKLAEHQKVGNGVAELIKDTVETINNVFAEIN